MENYFFTFKTNNQLSKSTFAVEKCENGSFDVDFLDENKHLFSSVSFTKEEWQEFISKLLDVLTLN